eukprot:CAMPEP_0204217830 /NCGR_PEP_ID=MMETSP0361-20130328/79188_1 /ASSEMBLY_ACC=CAM_ASM_000343 /TAXON_ID=268821 /ORGANISM="Scrippsiella Hangoei, Strain SHTV-5" /LENGTH=96 /DNA_ID=CAMNT_0051182891 /DNA_START=226 /DNA_END=513 /DNA_ORIENTATION=-
MTAVVAGSEARGWAHPDVRQELEASTCPIQGEAETEAEAEGGPSMKVNLLMLSRISGPRGISRRGHHNQGFGSRVRSKAGGKPSQLPGGACCGCFA